MKIQKLLSVVIMLLKRLCSVAEREELLNKVFSYKAGTEKLTWFFPACRTEYRQGQIFMLTTAKAVTEKKLP